MEYMGDTAKDTKALVDFIYKDSELITSLYAQIFAGNLTTINKNSSDTDERSTNMSGGMKIAGFKAESKEVATQSIQELIDPHDYKIGQILEQLGLEVYDEISDLRQDQLVIIRGQVIIRDIEMIKTLCNSDDILRMMAGDNQESIGLVQMIKAFSSFLPSGIEFELLTKDNKNITGSLKEQYLTTSKDDLTRLYGGRYPSQYYVLGIVDKLDGNSSVKAQSQFKQGIDEMVQGIFNMYNDNSTDQRLIIKPIVVYRELKI